MKNEGGENTETRSYVIFIIGMILLQYFISTPVFFINDYLICVILILFAFILGIFTVSISHMWLKSKKISKVLYEFAIFNLVFVLPTIVLAWLSLHTVGSVVNKIFRK